MKFLLICPIFEQVGIEAVIQENSLRKVRMLVGKTLQIAFGLGVMGIYA